MDRELFDRKHEAFRQRFRSFIEKEVTPQREAWAEAGVVSREVWEAAGREGFLCTGLASEWGGGGHDFLYSVVICEELARAHEFGVGFNLHSDMVVPYIERLGTDAVKERYLRACAAGTVIGAVAITEATGGSDVAAIHTRATYDADRKGYTLSGEKVFIANGELCDIVVLVARTAEGGNPQKAHSLFLVDTRSEGFRRGAKLRKIGFASQDTHELILEGCFVPESQRLGAEGAGMFYVLQTLQRERLVVAATAQARAEQVFEETLAWAKTHTVSGRPLSHHQHSAFVLAECAAKLEVGRVFVDHLCKQEAAGGYLQKESAMAKLWTTDMAFEVVDACLQLWGARGTVVQHGTGRAFGDVRLQKIYAGTNEVMKLIIANQLGIR